MKKLIYLISLFVLYFVNAQEKAVPHFKNGEAQKANLLKERTGKLKEDSKNLQEVFL